MSATTFLSALRSRLADAVMTWAPGARGAWCRSQRSRLRSSGGTVIWVRGAAVPWAEWGALRGYFELQHMDGLPYLRAPAPPAV
jgi:hypothetical protein